MSRMSRRRMLRLLGGMGLAAPFVNLGRQRALAATGRVPRVVFLFHSSGWQLRELGHATGTVFDPLRDAGLMERTTVIRGLHNRVCTANNTGDAHTGNGVTLLSGEISLKHPGFQPPYGGVTRVYGGAKTFDQVLADRWASEVAVPSAHMGILTSNGYNEVANLSHQVLSWRGPASFRDGDPVYDNGVFCENDPAEVHRTLFGATDGDAVDAGAAVAEARRRARMAALGYLDGELAAVGGTLRAHDRERLDVHRSAVAAMRTQLERGEIVLPDACSVPELFVGEVDQSPNYENLSNAQIANAVAALSCDVTRVVMLQHGMAGGGVTFRDDDWFFGRYGFTVAQAKRDLAEGNSSNNLSHSVISAHAASHATGPSSFPYYHRFGQWHAGQVARLASALRDVSTDSGTLLDDTLIVWFSENGQVSHGQRDIPFVLVGGDNWVRTGLDLDVGGATQVPMLRTLGRALTGDASFTIGDDDYAEGLERFAPLLRS